MGEYTFQDLEQFADDATDELNDHEDRITALENPDIADSSEFPLDPNIQSGIEQTLFQTLMAQVLRAGLPVYTVARNITQTPPMNGEMWVESISGVNKMCIYVNGSKITLPNVTTGTATLSGGTVTKSDGNILSTSIILFSRNGSSGTLGHLSLASQTTGSVVFNSSSNSDASTINYIVIN